MLGLSMRLSLIVGGMLALLVGLTTAAFAGGFSFTPHGAAASGKAHAVAGEANDPSPIFFNPAGVTQPPGTQLKIGTPVVELDSPLPMSTTGWHKHLSH